MTETIHLHADPEHAGLRLAVIGAFFGGAILSFFIVSALLPQNSLVLALVVGFVAGGAAATLLERGMKGRWRSGREVELAPSGIKLLMRGAAEVEISAYSNIEILRWRFQPKGRGRAPRGWSVVACALAQDERKLAVYTLMSPQSLESLADRDKFKELTSEKRAASAVEDIRLAGEQRRLREAEAHRWQTGAELSNEDFLRFVAYAEKRFED
jgi:hypothetical protein